LRKSGEGLSVTGGDPLDGAADGTDDAVDGADAVADTEDAADRTEDAADGADDPVAAAVDGALSDVCAVVLRGASIARTRPVPEPEPVLTPLPDWAV
jgi:hypothetical protein